jgi:hypothetical protein
LLFILTRLVLRRIVNLKLRWQRQSSEWQLLSGELLQRRFALPVIMTEGPRWNTHATIARVGPLDVRQSLEVQVSQAAVSARTWTIVLYSFPGHDTSRVLRPQDTGRASKGWIHLTLPTGSYSLIARYYDPSVSSVLPAVRVDNKPQVESIPVPAAANEFYERLDRRHNLFYKLLHYHAYVALRHRTWLPKSLVRKIYLPVGNPETVFRYGALAPGQSLRVELTSCLLDACDVYITFYDIASFPLRWQRIESSTNQWAPLGRRCTYLIRFHRGVAAMKY